jgi:hypothetical protein
MSINSHLQSISQEAYISGFEKYSINTSIESLKRRLKLHFPNQLRTHFRFGSHTRGTILPRSKDPQSDIDYMIVFKDNDSRPQTYLDRIKRFAETYYSRSEISQSNPTITLELNHIKFDLVPAIQSFFSLSDYQIPAKASSYNDWISTDPNDFNSTLIQKNKDNHSLIKPLIRIMKYWNALNDYPFESFELEKKIVNKFYFFWNTPSLKDYFYDFVSSLSYYEFSSSWKNDKVQSLKEKIDKIKNEENSFPITSENNLKKILP